MAVSSMVNSARWTLAPSGVGSPIANSRLPNLDDVRGIVSRTLSRAKSLGRDDLTQTRDAADAVMAVRPDLTLAQAMSGIARLQAAGAV